MSNKSEITEVLVNFLRGTFPFKTSEELAATGKLLGDAVNAYISALSDPTINPADIAKEFVAQCRVAFEKMRVDTRSHNFGAEELISLLGNLIHILVKV